MIDLSTIDIPAVQVPFDLAHYKIHFTKQNLISAIYQLKERRIPSGTQRFWIRITTSDHVPFTEEFWNNISKAGLEEYFGSKNFADLRAEHEANGTPILFDGEEKKIIYLTNLTFGYY